MGQQLTLSWFQIPSAELPEVLRGDSALNGYGTPRPDLFGGEVVLGVPSYSNGFRSAVVPAIALVGSSSRNLFSWISTYAEDTFPISQFCRVCSIEDWADLKLDRRTDSSVGFPSAIWPSVILGEMLGQSDAGLGLSDVPLNRSIACFSFAVARTLLLYPDIEIALERCIDRLAAVESDSRFARRQVNTSQLKKVWGTARTLQGLPKESLGSTDAVLRILSAMDWQVSNLLANNIPLRSDSAEDRVIGFEEVAESLLSQNDSWRPEAFVRGSNLAALAAAAVLAGRGTGHIGLIRPIARKFPEVLVWYGLFAGILGPRAWDRAWMQQAKGIERGIRQFFRPDEPVNADICWPEYEWIAKTYESPEMLTTIPRNIASSLAIELVPGAVCQFRIGERGPLKTVDDLRSPELRTIDSPSKDDITKAVALLFEAQKLLQQSRRGLEPGQNVLFNGSPTTDQGRGRKRVVDRPKK